MYVMVASMEPYFILNVVNNINICNKCMPWLLQWNLILF